MVSAAQPDSRPAETLLDRLRRRNLRAVSRAISMVENGHPEAEEIVDALVPSAGRAMLVGVTGVPGAGKSTLVPVLARRYSAAGKSVAILAVDPSSPLTGGAILGDRIRDTALGETDIFFRSLASRGSIGGLSRTIDDVVTLLDGVGFDVILIETVGSGQSDIGVTRLAQTTIMVAAPGLGDDIQAIKSGILEVADIIAVNKADTDPAEARTTAQSLQQALASATRAHGLREGANPASGDSGMAWLTPVRVLSAYRGDGIDALVEAVADHQAYLGASGKLVDWRRQRLLARFEEMLRDALMRQVSLGWDGALKAAGDAVTQGEKSPLAAARALANRVAPVRGENFSGRKT